MNRLNRYRALRAELALRNYSTDEDLATCLVDFLTDARHWCDRSGENYSALDRRARHHYRFERGAAKEAV